MPAQTETAPKARKKARPAPIDADPAPAPVKPLPTTPEAAEARLTVISDVRDISPRLIERMTSLVDPEKIARKISELLDSTRWIVSGKDSDGTPHMREIPDIRAQEAAVKLWLAYVIGMPVQRQEIVTRNIGELDDLMERAAQSPAVVRTMERTLEAIRARRAESETPEK